MGRIPWVAVLVLLGGCGPDLSTGAYLFQRTQELRSSCAVDPPLPVEWVGEVTVRGLTVTIELRDPAFRVAVDQKALVGVFQEDDRREDPRFLSDSTFDDVATIEGTSCFVFTHLQIEGTVPADDRIVGVARVVDSRQLEADRACPFACVQEVAFEARKR
ncbi:MAG TPA: hypothetical protein VN033_00750 [Vulgatibacter sp.]|nr:hypothetical protein [Vulgatibacter sp.]